MRTLNLNVPILYDFLVLNNLCFPYPKLLRHSKSTLDEYNIKVENDVLQKKWFYMDQTKSHVLKEGSPNYCKVMAAIYSDLGSSAKQEQITAVVAGVL